ncbi:uncharacterized protein LOC104895928 [Beta vulgaris subsp. vulgaris]|uniref:uncharacterized protein LOC104895928 n=1 Tax=Beta vulgaris subsp. vulgaris TaxID=3555 RepID=UPI002036FA90|nr:uncharacterized protein LOC104895928 [Beta vulgaris subsp. vulgaris]
MVDAALVFTLDDLSNAARNGDISFFESLSRKILSKVIKLRDKSGASLLHLAAVNGHCQLLKILIDADHGKTLIHDKDNEGYGIVHFAALSGHLDIARFVIDNGADIDVVNYLGETALHLAAIDINGTEVAKMLVVHGADVNAKDKFVYNAHVVWWLILENLSQFGNTPMHRAASTGNLELCKFLIQYGAEIDALDRSEITPLMVAALANHKEVALYLTRSGAIWAGLNEAEEGYMTVLERCSEDVTDAILETLKEMGMIVDHVRRASSSLG